MGGAGWLGVAAEGATGGVVAAAAVIHLCRISMPQINDPTDPRTSTTVATSMMDLEVAFCER
jgi:hypothetical protein